MANVNISGRGNLLKRIFTSACRSETAYTENTTFRYFRVTRAHQSHARLCVTVLFPFKWHLSKSLLFHSPAFPSQTYYKLRNSQNFKTLRNTNRKHFFSFKHKISSNNELQTFPALAILFDLTKW
jgi:hypothetical protein